MADVNSIFAAMAERRNNEMNEAIAEQEAMIQEEMEAEAMLEEEYEEEYEDEYDEEVDEEVDELVESAINFLEANGYEVDEESIEAVIEDMCSEEEDEEEYEIDEEIEELIEAAASFLAENGYEVDEESIEAVINDWSLEEDEEEEDADVEEQAGGANIGTAPADRKAERYDGNGEDKAPTKGAAAPTDRTPSKPSPVENGEDGWKSNKPDTANKTNNSMKYAEEEESEEENLTEDVAELQCRLEECGGSKFMFQMLSDGKTDMVKRYLDIKEA